MKIPDPLLVVARRLGDLRERVVFVGGMIRSLLVTDPGASRARPTDDVDLIVDVSSNVDFYALGNALRSREFCEANEEGAPICRWTVEGVRVDVMPVDPAILGFSNVWYFGAHQSSLPVAVAEGTIHILDAPHFCATKLEAFLSRGNRDFYHHDLEDFIAIVDGRLELMGEIAATSEELRTFLADEVAALLTIDAFVEALPGHLDGDLASQSRLPLVMNRLLAIASFAGKPVARSKPFGQIAPSPIGDEVMLRSSNLRSASYDATTSTLTIRFRNGSTYRYDRVPATVYAGLLSAASAGRYHHQWIRVRYVYQRVR